MAGVRARGKKAVGHTGWRRLEWTDDQACHKGGASCSNTAQLPVTRQGTESKAPAVQPGAFPAAQRGVAAAALGGSGGGSPKRSPAGQSATAASPEARRSGGRSQPGPREGGTNQHGVARATPGPATTRAHLDPTVLPARAKSSSASTPLLHMVGRWPAHDCSASLAAPTSANYAAMCRC